MATIDINRLIQDSIITAQSSSPIIYEDINQIDDSLKRVIFEDVEEDTYDFKQFLK